MKTRRKSRNASRQTRNLTLGELIAATYKSCGKGAPKILQLALESDLVRFARQPSYS